MRRIAILAEGVFDWHYAGKAVASLIQNGIDPTIAVIDSTKAGLDVSQALNVSFGQDVPVVSDIMQALIYQPDTLFIAVIPTGSRYLNEPLRWQVLHAIHSGLDITAFSIDFLINDEEISLLAEENGVSIYVDKQEISSTILEDMRPEAGRTIVAPPIPETPLGNRLWSAIQPVLMQSVQPGASPILNAQSQTLLETFLTTNKSMHDLVGTHPGITSMPGVRKNLYASLGRVWDRLPQEAKQGYQSPKEALQDVATSQMKTEEVKRKMRENERRSGYNRPSWKDEKPRQTGKANKGKKYNVQRDEEGRKIFSPDHHTHLSNAATRRWQRQRETQQPESTTNTPT